MKFGVKQFFMLCFILLSFYKGIGQTTNISGVINNYASITSIGSQSVNVSSAAGFAAGDKVLLIQMKGASIDTSNTSLFGTINSYHDAGNYEILVVSSISGNTITFSSPFLRTYNVIGIVQLVKIPVYNNVNVVGVLTCTPWNGQIGGVLIFEANGNVTLNANIDVTGKGFLGGAKLFGQLGSCIGNISDFKLPISSLLSTNKGEGITIIQPSFAKGLGALANGGGAGNDVNGGGAGGGNYGQGGHGGNSKCSSSAISLCGGYEGKNCVYSNSSNKIFLGGGGGAGHENDGLSTGGVSGGGIVIIRSGGSIFGNNNFINANGNNNTFLAGNDGQGGGGAGGTVLIDACSTSSLNIAAKGGNGGTDNYSGPDCHGKGGGGGGGVIWTSSAFPYNSFLNGGNPGLFTNINSQCYNNSNGATVGQVGASLTGLSIPGALPLSPLGNYSLTLSSHCIGNNNSTVIGTITTNAISSIISYTWTNSFGAIVSQTSNTSSLIDSVSNLSNGIYTLSIQPNAPCGSIITQTININCVSSSTVPCTGILTGTGMSVCNQFNFSITPSQTITPFNYGSQNYSCNNTTQPDVSFNIMGPGWRVQTLSWNFVSTINGQINGYNSSGVLQTIPFLATNTITPLNYSGGFVQFAINGVASGAMLNQSTFSISITSAIFGSNTYTYCANTATSIVISPVVPSTGGPWTYNWQPGNLTGNPINVSPISNTIYTVMATSAGAGCSSTTTVAVNINCPPNPALCSGNLGSPIFFEDFGSGVSLYGPALPPGVTNYSYLQGVPNNGTYVIASSSNPSGTNAGYVNDNNDHTGNANGYMMVVNSDYPASEVYRRHVTGLCQNTTYVFSAYLANNNSPDAVTNVCAFSYVYANIKFQTEFPLGTVLNSITSGNLAVASNSVTLPWIQYGFTFTTGPGQTSVDVVLKNNAPGGCGNDYVVDDISLSPCGPGVSLSIAPNYTTFCPGETVSLQSTFTSGSYVSPQYQWQYSSDGGVTWSNISGATSANYTINSVSAAQSGMYQLLIAENGNINSPSCRIEAGPISFSVTSGSLTVSNQTTCAGSNVTLTATGGTTYTWSNGVVSNAITVNPSVTTDYTVTSAIGSCTNQAIVTVSVIPLPTITVVSFTNTSCGLNNGSILIMSSPATNTYTWSGGITSTTNTANSLAPGNYSVSVNNGACHTSTVVNVLSSIALQIISATVTPSDCNVNNGSISVVDNYSSSTYSWSPNVSLINTASNLSPSNYALTITNGSCSTSTVFIVPQLNGPTSINVNQNDAICESLNGNISITSISNGTSPYQYSFNNSSFSSVNTFSNLSQGIYTITVKDLNSCVYTSTFTINKSIVSSSIQLTTNFPTCNANDGSFVINSTTGGTPPFLWSFNGSSFSTISVFEELGAGEYVLMIRDSNLCETNLNLEMPMDKNDYTLYVPNTFTPNKDLVNDTWFAKATCINSFSCIIFNRWGEKIIELKDINEYWDGTYKGKNVPDGVYVYLIEAETNNGTVYKNGHITLFR